MVKMTVKVSIFNTCFFIYKAGLAKSRYLVGYDGSWNAPTNSNISFDRCWDAAHKFISNYDA